LAESLEAKLKEFPQNVSLYETLANTYEKLGMDEKVISMSEKVAQLQPLDMRNYYRLALAYNRADMKDKAATTAKEMASGKSAPVGL